MASYLIKYIVCSGILLAVYHFLLEREKMLRFNRLYLLVAMVFSLLIPLATIKMPSRTAETIANYKPIIRTITSPVSGSRVSNAVIERSGMPEYLPWLVYALLSILLLARLAFQMAQIHRFRMRYGSGRFETAHLILLPGNVSSYTFFNAIFISREAFATGRIPREILTHELAHAKQMHSLDIVFTEMLFALCWFNPILLLYRRAIRQNHEFLADEAVLAGKVDVGQYQLLLLDTLLSQRKGLVSSFNYPVTKKRLAMMIKTDNRKIQFAKQTAVLLIMFTLGFTFSEKTYSQKNPEKPGTAAEMTTISEKIIGEGVTKAEMDAFFATLDKHTRYVINEKGRRDPITEMDGPTMKEQFAIYSRMSPEQRIVTRKAGIALYEDDIPVKKAPSPEMFGNWKKPHIFGIWLDGKHVPNTRLDRYKNTDIAEYTLHRLVGKGLKGKGYKYQLELTTNEEFDKTFEQRVENRIVLVRSLRFASPKAKNTSKK